MISYDKFMNGCVVFFHFSHFFEEKHYVFHAEGTLRTFRNGFTKPI